MNEWIDFVEIVLKPTLKDYAGWVFRWVISRYLKRHVYLNFIN